MLVTIVHAFDFIYYPVKPLATWPSQLIGGVVFNEMKTRSSWAL